MALSALMRGLSTSVISPVSRVQFRVRVSAVFREHGIPRARSMHRVERARIRCTNLRMQRVEPADTIVCVCVLTHLQLPTIESLYGAMQANADYVIMGAGPEPNPKP